MTKRERIALLIAVAYIAIMGIGMATLTARGLIYDRPEMVKVIVYFEAAMSALVAIGHHRLRLKTLTRPFRFTKWLLPFGLIWLLMVGSLVGTGRFNAHVGLIALVGLTTVLVGFSEELMFRGIVLNVFLEKRGPKVAILVSAIVFSLLHAVNILGGVPLAGVPIQLLLTFLFGLIFSSLALLMQNLLPLMIYHAVWDFAVVSQPLTGANVMWVVGVATVVELLVVIPLVRFAIKRNR